MDPQYALVAYVRHPLGDFVQNLRRELHPDLPHLPAHLTILPPRRLAPGQPGSDEHSVLQGLEFMCRGIDPFEVAVGDVETFVPVTPTVFLRVEHAAYRLRELHDRLAVGALAGDEQWPYMPHLTIVKMGGEQSAMAAFEFARDRWKDYSGSRRIVIEELTFVRESENNTWIDLASVRLGRSLVSGKR
jgi:2'-5' RNA ligase